MARVDLPKSNLRERRRRRRAILLSLIAAGVLLLLAAIVGVTWLPLVRIRAIDITGQKTIQQNAIQQAVQNELYGGYLHLFARSNIFLYPKGAITQQLLGQFPTLASVDVHAENFHTLGVTVVERQPIALWCGTAVATTSSCYLLDDGGAVYAPAVIYSGDAYQKFYGAVVGSSLPQQFLSPGQFHSLSTLVAALQTKQGSTAQSINVDENQDVWVVFENGFELIFALNTNTGDVLDRFVLALTADPFTTHPLSDFAYLDLRFGDKLYYKLKGQ